MIELVPLSKLLTPLELHIASMVADGYSNRAIADSRGVTVMAVRQRLTRVYEKLGLEYGKPDSCLVPRIMLALRYDREVLRENSGEV